MKIVQAHFKHLGREVYLAVPFEEGIVRRFKDGFWIYIDDNLPKLAQKWSDCMYFIPPHMVQHLEMKDVEVDDYEQYNGEIQRFPE